MNQDLASESRTRRTFSWPLINYRIDVRYKHKIIFVSPLGLLIPLQHCQNPDIFHTWDYLHASFDLISFQHLEQNSLICFKIIVNQLPKIHETYQRFPTTVEHISFSQGILCFFFLNSPILALKNFPFREHFFKCNSPDRNQRNAKRKL